MSIPDCGPSNSDYLDGVEAAVRVEISELHNPDLGLAAVAVALAKILDNPKAISSQPPAARQLIKALDRLHATSSRRRGNLSVVRSMTKKGGA